MRKIENKLPPNAKCTRCGNKAIVRLPSHNAKFCEECFLFFFTRAIHRGLKKLKIKKREPLLVAVSGGKDSLTVWDVLDRLGYKTKGFHLNLGIPEFSEKSIETIENFAKKRSLPWVLYDLKKEFGYSLPEVYKKLRRKICSICGRIKRHLINRIAYKEGYKIVVTGHNLDDEASRLLGNLIWKREDLVKKQHPFLPSIHEKVPGKLKPLYRVTIDEILIYCKLRDIEFVTVSCPYSKGATSHKLKEALDFIEKKIPGTKRNFLFAYVENKPIPQDKKDFGECKICGFPSHLEVCGLCLLKERLQNSKN